VSGVQCDLLRSIRGKKSTFVESFQDSVLVGCGSQGVARASLNPVLGYLIPAGISPLVATAQSILAQRGGHRPPPLGLSNTTKPHVLKAHPLEGWY